MSPLGGEDGAEKFPDFVPLTKVQYQGEDTPTLHLRRCTISIKRSDGEVSNLSFEKEEVRIGARDDNDIVLRDNTTSRYHCKIVQEDSGYVLVDLRSTNGTFINGVRIREAYLEPNCTILVGKLELTFNASEEKVAIEPSSSDRLGHIVGRNKKMRELYAIIERIAPTATTVVIEGETGTGKEVVAQTIHDLSPRKDGNMVIFDCGAVPPNLIESELFGHEKGSFTGATMSRQGLFELADGGTLFLDELGELPIDLQPKLLRALEQREVRRVGGSKPIKVDARIIAATNRDLQKEVKAGRFREDLFYRLSVVRLTLPSLRQRTDDIGVLVQHLLNERYADNPSGVTSLSPGALACMENYGWPGNVRELVNAIERSLSFCDSNSIQVDNLPEHIRPNGGIGQIRVSDDSSELRSVGTEASTSLPGEDLSQVPFKDAKEQWVSSFEKDYIVSLLTRHAGNISHAAREADIDRKYFRKLMKKYEISAADMKE